MCLNLSSGRKVPFNNGNIRWKVVQVNNGGKITAPYRSGHIYNELGWNYAQFNSANFNPANHGFHVFVNHQAAYARVRKSYRLKVKKVEVRGFLAAGTFNSRPSETWAAMKFIK